MSGAANFAYAYLRRTLISPEESRVVSGVILADSQGLTFASTLMYPRLMTNFE